MAKLSIIIPAYNEQRNIPVLLERLRPVMDSLAMDWEWIFVDDHSTDGTFEALCSAAQQEPRIRVIRLARNVGSYTALVCGLNHTKGDCAVVLAADLQDPPELIPELVSKWTRGAQVVFAARRRREGEKASTIGFSRLYYFILRRIAGITELPASGADFFLLDRRVIDALGQCRESNTGLMPLIAWLGFRQDTVFYDKQARLHGRSGWTLRKKIKLAVDSMTAFSYLPIRVMSLFGVLFAAGGLLWAVVVVVGRLTGYIVAGTGYAAIMTVLLLGFGFLMTFLGILGEYLWRTFDEVRARPRYIIDHAVNLTTTTGQTTALQPAHQEADVLVPAGSEG